MQTWNERLRAAIEESALTKRALAASVGVSAPTVTDWTTGKIKQLSAGNAERVCAALGINTRWLLTGKGEMRASRGLDLYSKNGIPSGYEQKSIFSIPLLTWEEAAQSISDSGFQNSVNAEVWMPRPPEAGPKTFALPVVNETMTSPYPGQRSYPIGTIIYVDPERPVTNGCRVIARVDGALTFKVYVEDAGRKYLKPINPTYDKIDITEGVHICGVVIGSYLPE